MNCLQDFYNSCITQGEVDSVKCLDPGCGKNLIVEVLPGKRRKIDPAWLEKMRLRAEEEKRVAEEAATGDAAGSTSGAAVEVASTHAISSSSVDPVEPVSAISSAYESEAEVEQSLEHAQGVGRNDSGMLDNVMDEDDLHVEDTRASTTEASSSRSRLSERERDYEHGSPEANNVSLLPHIIVPSLPLSSCLSPATDRLHISFL